MGLDFVETVIATEEAFSVNLPDDECESVRTVGDLYRLVLKHLDLPYIPPRSEIILGVSVAEDRSRLTDADPSTLPWTQADVWATLRDLIQNQLQVDLEGIRDDATFLDDLRCD
jgi:acyl carrier protein